LVKESVAKKTSCDFEIPYIHYYLIDEIFRLRN